MPKSTKIKSIKNQKHQSITKENKPVWLWTLGVSLILTFIFLGVYLVLAAAPGTLNPSQAPPGDDVVWGAIKTCPVGRFMTSFDLSNANAPTCADAVSSVTGSGGITANPTTGAVGLSLANSTKSCLAGQAIRSFDLSNANAPTCEVIASGLTGVGAGNDNYLARWNGDASLEKSAIYQTDTGDVGIGGVPGPGAKLDVNGDISTNAGITLGGVRRTAWPSFSLDYSTTVEIGPINGNGSNRTFNCPNGYVVTGLHGGGDSGGGGEVEFIFIRCTKLQ